MFLAGVSLALLPGGIRVPGVGTLTGPWKFTLSALYIAVGVGLLARFQWARLAAIAIATLRIGLIVVGLVSGLRQVSAMLVLSWLVGFPRDGLIVWYLLRPEIARAFAGPTGTISASVDTNQKSTNAE
jgi:hypothetical protein